MQSSNINETIFTDEVLKFKISNEINDLHPANIANIDITDEVENDDIFNEIKFLHSKNIQFISVSFSVLKFDKSKDFNDRHL